MACFRDSIQLNLANICEGSHARSQMQASQGALLKSETLSQRYLATTQMMMVALDMEGRRRLISWQEVTENREMRVIELKHEVNELLAKAGQPPRHPSVEQGLSASPEKTPAAAAP